MRFNDRITLVNQTNSYYDPIKGEYVDGEVIETTKPCNASTLDIERTNELFGEIDKKIVVARLQRPYVGKVDYAYINDGRKTKYKPQRQSDYRKGVFYLEGVSQ